MITATAQALPNIEFIKSWGNRDNILRLAVSGSISMNLDGLFTQTTVSFQPSLPFDELITNGREVTGKGLEQVSFILDLVCKMAKIENLAEVMTENTFPSEWGQCPMRKRLMQSSNCLYFQYNCCTQCLTFF